jgi:hypothetical protein
LAYKSPKTPFLAALKYLTRYTQETFFEEYTNFEAHYLSRYRDIPLQSFGSHIRPQPHGLGLTVLYLTFALVSQRKVSTIYLQNFDFSIHLNFGSFLAATFWRKIVQTLVTGSCSKFP